MNIEEFKNSFEKIGDKNFKPSVTIFDIYESACKIASEEECDTVYTQHLLKALFAPDVLWLDPNKVVGGSSGEKARRIILLQEVAKKLSDAILNLPAVENKATTPPDKVKISEHLLRAFSNAKCEHMRIKNPEVLLSYLNFKPKTDPPSQNGKKARIRKSKQKNIPVAKTLDLGDEILTRAGLSESVVHDIAKSVALFKPQRERVLRA